MYQKLLLKKFASLVVVLTVFVLTGIQTAEADEVDN